MSERFSDEQARRLWERATQLQAEAARRREALGPGEGGSDAEGDAGDGSMGYAVEHVRQAALEAGIDPEFVDQALAEARSGMLSEEAEDTSFADRFLGPGPHWLVAEQTVKLAPREVLEALRRVFPRLKLTLVDSRGGRPEEGGVLVFEVDYMRAMMQNRALMELAHASVSEVHASLHPTSDGGCRIVLKAPQVKPRRTSARVGLPSVVVTGLGIGAAATAIAFSVMGAGGITAVEALLGVSAAVGSGGAGGFGFREIWRQLQNWGHRKGQKGLERLLQLVVTDARTEGGFTKPDSSADTSLGKMLGIDQLGI